MEVKCCFPVYQIINVCCDFADVTGAYDKIWILGDKFVYDSAAVLKEMFNLVCDNGNDNNLNSSYSLDASDEGQMAYLRKHFDVEVFASNASGQSRSVLARFCNVLAKALEAHNKFPKYIIFVIEDDLLRCVNFENSSVSSVFSEILAWLTSEIHEMIHARKGDLPLRSKRYLYPQVFWAALPLHMSLHNQLRQKFNQGLESVTSQFNEMKILRIKRHWSFNDASLVSGGMINGDGKQAYWSGIDEAIDFWENGRKKSFRPVGNGSGREFIKRMKLSHDVCSKSVRHSRWDNYHNFGFNKQVRLPRLQDVHVHKRK